MRGYITRYIDGACVVSVFELCSELTARLQIVETKAYGRLGHMKSVLHVVTRIGMSNRSERGSFELSQLFLNCLKYANWRSLRSVAFPFIGSGWCLFCCAPFYTSHPLPSGLISLRNVFFLCIAFGLLMAIMIIIIM